jgi:hypothetical protein
METGTERLSRLQGMADGDDTWDLSDNDTAAIQWILTLCKQQDTSLAASLKREETLREALRHFANDDNWFDCEEMPNSEGNDGEHQTLGCFVPAWRGPMSDMPEKLAQQALAACEAGKGK